MRDQIAIVPVYQPSERFVEVVKDLARAFRRVVVVDDGSDERREQFDRLADLERVTLLRHDANRGKGAALKTAFRHVLADPQGAQSVVTVDADGQHLPADVMKTADAALANPGKAVLGVRTFSGRIPFRSRLGNLWTIGEFRLLTGRTVHDTQSGLRALPVTLLPQLLEIPGERYEYEIGVLTALAKAGLLIEVPISTVYLDGNSTSHYRPLADTFSTQSALFRAAVFTKPLRSS